MAGKIKCSYDDCHKHFKSYESMIEHKIKEPTHEYCKRCDVDCEDDIAYLIHQMNNPKHIACCICGQEFRSEAGRDAHVELYHQRNQNLPCVGCQMVFSKAGELMRHIENDECDVISADLYQRRRAEKQIEKDAWAQALDYTNIRSFVPSQTGAGSETETNAGGVSLLDDHDAHSSGLDWQGATPRTVGPLQPSATDGDAAHGPAVQSVGALLLDKFPSLPAQHKNMATKSKLTTSSPNGNDILSFDEADVKTKALGGGPWNSKIAPKSFFAASKPLHPKPNHNDGGSLSSSGNVSSGSKSNQPISMFDRLSQVSTANSQPSHPPPPPHNNPNTRIRTVPAEIAPKSSLDPWKYFDPLQNAFICPGQKCRAKHATAKAFDDHLTTSAHVGGKTVCPSCLGKFNTTAALISHCESGSKKCTIRKSVNYNQVMRELTAGLLGTEGHLIDGSVKYVANKLADW